MQHSLNGAPVASTKQLLTCAYSEHDAVDITLL